MLSAALSVFASCAEPFDDTEIWESIDELKSKVAALEAAVAENVSAIQSMVSVGSIASWEYDATTGKAVIKLTDGKTVTIDQTAKGYSLVTVEQDEDGNYYWAVCKDGVTAPLEIGGKKVPVTVTPSLKISDDNEWMISVDGGKTWVNTGIAYNEQVTDSDVPVFFKNIEQEGNYLVLTLADGTEIKVEIVGEATFKAASDTLWFARNSMEKSVAIEMTGVKEYTITEKPEGWKARIEESYLFVTSPESFETCPAKGEVKILALFEGGSPEIVSIDVIHEPMFTLSRNDENVTVQLSEHTGEDFIGYVLRGWKKSEYSADAAVAWLNENFSTLVPYEGTASYKVSEIVDGYSEDESYVIFAVPYLPVRQINQGSMEYLSTDIVTVSYKKTIWNVSEMKYDSAMLTAVIDAELGYYGGFMDLETWTNYGMDNMLETLSYGGAAVYENLSYNGPVSAFPSGSDPMLLMPATEYVAWYLPVKEDNSYTKDDFVTRIFKTDDIAPSSSVAAPAYEVAEVTINGFTAEATPAQGTYKTYAAAVKASAVPATDDETVRYLIRNGVVSEGQEKNVLTVSSYSDADEVYYIAVSISEDGSYGAVAKEQVELKALSFVDNIGMVVKSVEQGVGTATLKLEFTGNPVSMTYLVQAYDPYFSDDVLQRLLALDQLGDAATIALTSSEAEIHLDGLANGMEYKMYAIVRNAQDNSSALYKYTFIQEMGVDYILEDDKDYTYGMPQMSGSWSDSDTYVLNVIKPAECRKFWLFKGDREYFPGDAYSNTDKLITCQMEGTTVHEESVTGKVYTAVKSHSRIYMAWQDDKGEFHQIYEYKPAK